MQGKLNKLTSTFVAMNPSSVQAGLQVKSEGHYSVCEACVTELSFVFAADVPSPQEAYQALDRLLLGCLAHKKDLMERQIDDSQQAGDQ